MYSSHNPLLRLRTQIASLESLLADLRTELADAEAYYNRTTLAQSDTNGLSQTQDNSCPLAQPVRESKKAFENLVDQLELSQEDKWGKSWELTPQEYKRYGRQLIMPEIGLRGGLSSLKCNGWLSLTPTGNRPATT